eukprot:UN08935
MGLVVVLHMLLADIEAPSRVDQNKRRYDNNNKTMVLIGLEWICFFLFYRMWNAFVQFWNKTYFYVDTHHLRMFLISIYYSI